MPEVLGGHPLLNAAYERVAKALRSDLHEVTPWPELRCLIKAGKRRAYILQGALWVFHVYN